MLIVDMLGYNYFICDACCEYKFLIMKSIEDNKSFKI